MESKQVDIQLRKESKFIHLRAACEREKESEKEITKVYRWCETIQFKITTSQLALLNVHLNTYTHSYFIACLAVGRMQLKFLYFSFLARNLVFLSSSMKFPRSGFVIVRLTVVAQTVKLP
jgi:hypothetical protein